MAEETAPESPTPAAPLAPTNLEAQFQEAMQAALLASQESAVRVCLGALDPGVRTDDGTYGEALVRLQQACQAALDRLQPTGG